MSTTTIGATETELEEHDDEIERVPWGYVRVGDIDIAIGSPPKGAGKARDPGESIGYLGMIPDYRPPTSPGEMLLEEFLKPLGISQRQLADAICLPYRQVNGIINERRPVTPAIALRLTRYIGMSVGFWMNLQLAWDLYHAAQQEAETLSRIEPFPRPDLEDMEDFAEPEPEEN